MTGLIPLLCALALLQASATLPGSAVAAPTLTGWLVGGSIAWVALCSTVHGLLIRLGSQRWLERWEFLAEALMLGGLAGLCIGLGWGRGWRAVTPMLGPWLLWQLWFWWSLTPVVNRICGTTYTHGAHLLHQVRFAILPAVLFLPVMDGVAAIGNHWELSPGTTIGVWFLQRLGQAGNVVASLAGGIGALTLGPWLLVRLWGTRPLPAGAMLDRLLAGCREFRIGISQVRTWQGAGGREYNAMVLGLVPAGRYVLFTNDLLAHLPADQLRAVLGHELSHARRRHLLVYLLFLANVGMAAWLAQQLASQLHPLPQVLHPQVLGPGLAVLVVIAAWRLGFGPLSRACERQADIDGAHFTSPQLMREALLSVVRLSGADPHQPSWHHGSMASRAEFLTRLAEHPALAQRHHLRLRLVWSGLLIALVVLGTLLARM